MYDEDRSRTLELYNSIFEEVGNETAVLQMLVSPTRQAVNLARAYDAKERKLQSEEDIPAYLLVIEDLRQQATTLMPDQQPANQDQLSLFEEPDAADAVFENLRFDLDDTPGEIIDDSHREISLFPDEDVPHAARRAAEPSGGNEVEAFSDAVDSFLADFSLPDNLDGQPDEEEEEQPRRRAQRQTPQEPAPEAPVHAAPERREADNKPILEKPLPDLEPAPVKRKPIVVLLILYILLAIPVALIGICILLLPAVLALGLAAAALYFGVAGLITAFHFSVIADILLVFGLSLALAAIGLFLFWFFVWLLFGAIPGLIRGLCALGRKLCYKEAAV